MTTLTLSSSALLGALQAVAGVVPRNPSIPVLSGILFDGRTSGRLRLVGSDLEVTMAVAIDVDAEGEPMHAVLPIAQIMQTLRQLPAQTITITVDDGTATIKASQGQYKVFTWAGEDFIDVDRSMFEGENEPATSEPDAGWYRRMIDKTVFAVGRDPLRPQMMGIFVEPVHGKAVATDGHRLATYSIDHLEHPDQPAYTIPEKAAQLISRLPESDVHYFQVTVTGNYSYLSIVAGNVELVARLIADPFPNYRAVIPEAFDRRLVINTQAFISAVKRVNLYAAADTGQLRLTFTQGVLTIAAEDAARAAAASERVLCEFTGADLEIGFNGAYLLEALQSIETDDVEFELQGPTRAAVVRPARQADNERIMMLLMPVMLR
jgi:DNA polymerase-3 subunit beta